jgi:energy-coupling factor transporter ATP-binding protein EcfA2
MKKFSWPTIRPGERVFFVGPSGSGKTEVARALLAAQKHAIILDTKGSEDWSDVGEICGPRDIYNVKNGRYVYSVEPDFLVDPARQEKFFRWCLARGNCVVYVDELLDILEVPGLKIVATQGRAKRVGLWTGTQRPHGVPIFALSEANHAFVWRLRVDRDRQRIESAVGLDRGAIPWDGEGMRRPFAFLYIDAKGNVAGPEYLRL